MQLLLLRKETLAATAGLDSQAGLQFRLNEVGLYPRSILLTDCRSLFDHVYAMTGKTAEILLPDIHELREAAMPWRSALSDEYGDNFIELWWCSTNVQYADHLTKKETPSTKELLDMLRHGNIRLGKDYLRPRPTQRAHSFWGSVSVPGPVHRMRPGSPMPRVFTRHCPLRQSGTGGEVQP